MDANTRDVLMALITMVITPLVVLYINRKQAKSIAAVKTEVHAVKTDVHAVKAGVEEYHKAVNGGFAKLLETTSELATAKEKARQADEDIKK